MSRVDIIKDLLQQRDDIVELQVQYSNGDEEVFGVDPDSDTPAADQLQAFVDDVNWDDVKEVEVEYENGEEHEVDFEELEDDDEDDDEDGEEADEQDDSDDDDDETNEEDAADTDQ